MNLSNKVDNIEFQLFVKIKELIHGSLTNTGRETLRELRSQLCDTWEKFQEDPDAFVLGSIWSDPGNYIFGTGIPWLVHDWLRSDSIKIHGCYSLSGFSGPGYPDDDYRHLLVSKKTAMYCGVSGSIAGYPTYVAHRVFVWADVNIFIRRIWQANSTGVRICVNDAGDMDVSIGRMVDIRKEAFAAPHKYRVVTRIPSYDVMRLSVRGRGINWDPSITEVIGSRLSAEMIEKINAAAMAECKEFLPEYYDLCFDRNNIFVEA